MNKLKSSVVIFFNSYPKELQPNSADTITISTNENKINEEVVKSKRKLVNGSLEILTQFLGIDGNENKPALINHTYLFGNLNFKIIKEV